MPYITSSSYQAPLVFRAAHLNTIYPALLRGVKGLQYQRETLELDDGDFLDLDWSRVGNGKDLLIALHGLEGGSDRPYSRGIIRYFNTQGWDGLALNFRSCSGRPNRLLKSYNMGVSDDLARVVAHAIRLGYERIVPLGFSLGGNVTLKYMGEQGAQLPSEVKAAIAFSVPCHIRSANVEIDKLHNRLYLNRFLKTLVEKMRIKATMFPDQLQVTKPYPRGFKEFDDQYTAPIHGYADAHDYWEKCSSLFFLEDICRPTLLVNAIDDTFLSQECYPQELASQHDYLFLETPSFGGHVGFVRFRADRSFWSEQRAWEFVQDVV